jgi:hypothetical protein
VSSAANLELNQNVQLKDAEIQKKMIACRKLDLKSHWRKLRLGLWPKLRLPVGEEVFVPAEDVVFLCRCLFEADKFRHSDYLEDPNNPGKMVEVNRDPEVPLLDHVMHQFVDYVKLVTEVRAVRLNFERVQGCQVHSVENPLGLSQLLPQPTPDKSSILNLLQKVALFLVRQPKDVFVQ